MNGRGPQPDKNDHHGPWAMVNHMGHQVLGMNPLHLSSSVSLAPLLPPAATSNAADFSGMPRIHPSKAARPNRDEIR